jgi:hypothetical protein
MFSGKTRVIPVTRTGYKSWISGLLHIFGDKFIGNKYYRFSLGTTTGSDDPRNRRIMDF